MFGYDIGPVEIHAGTSLASLAKIGDSRESVNVSWNESTATTRLNKTGLLARRKIITGAECKVTGAIGEATIAHIGNITGQTPDEGGTRLALKSRVGVDLRAIAKVYALKPIVNGVVSTTAAEWIVIPAGSIAAMLDLEHSVENGKQWNFEIEGHPVTAEEIASGGRLVDDGFEENDVLVFGD